MNFDYIILYKASTLPTGPTIDKLGGLFILAYHSLDQRCIAEHRSSASPEVRSSTEAPAATVQVPLGTPGRPYSGIFWEQEGQSHGIDREKWLIYHHQLI